MDFTTDWFSHVVESWQLHLSHLINKPCKVLEVGSFEGRSAIWTLQNILTDDQSTITCIDIWNRSEIEKRFDSNILKTDQSNKVIKIKSASYKALRQLPLFQYDFIYIDGSHEGYNVLEDAVLCFRLLKQNGILIFDDYLWEGKATIYPKPAIDAFLQMYQRHIKVLHCDWQIICQKHK